MTGFEVLHLVNVLTIWALALALMWIVGKMKFSVYKCFARLVFHKDRSCVDWLMLHKHYLYCLVVAWLLLFLSLGLLSQLYEGMVRIRREYTIIASACIFGFFVPLILTLFHRAYKHEIK